MCVRRAGKCEFQEEFVAAIRVDADVVRPDNERHVPLGKPVDDFGDLLGPQRPGKQRDAGVASKQCSQENEYQPSDDGGNPNGALARPQFVPAPREQGHGLHLHSQNRCQRLGGARCGSARKRQRDVRLSAIEYHFL